MRALLITLLFLTSCSAQSNLVCGSTITEKKNMLGETESATVCNCTCPQQKPTIVDGGGILGGLLSLFKVD